MKKHWAYKHGLNNTPEQKVWGNMKSRCLNTNHPRYKDWGGRGIKICDRWLGENGLKSFYEDMGKRPDRHHTLERKDNSRGYSPDNCYWADTRTQGYNRRSNKDITFNNVTLKQGQWAELLGINKVTLSSRLRRGWSIGKALGIE